MNGPFEDAYFNWLCAKVNRVEVPTPSLTYYHLLRILHSTEFVWLLSGDDNRAHDGVDLRHRFLVESGYDPDPESMNLGCSLLEMLIAFSYKAEFNTDIPAADWFWIFIENLGLFECTDAAYCSDEAIGEILYSLVWRQYGRDGAGGLFPLRNPGNDQREVEVWYQFCEYLVDQESL